MMPTTRKFANVNYIFNIGLLKNILSCYVLKYKVLVLLALLAVSEMSKYKGGERNLVCGGHSFESDIKKQTETISLLLCIIHKSCREQLIHNIFRKLNISSCERNGEKERQQLRATTMKKKTQIVFPGSLVTHWFPSGVWQIIQDASLQKIRTIFNFCQSTCAQWHKSTTESQCCPSQPQHRESQSWIKTHRAPSASSWAKHLRPRGPEGPRLTPVTETESQDGADRPGKGN